MGSLYDPDCWSIPALETAVIRREECAICNDTRDIVSLIVGIQLFNTSRWKLNFCWLQSTIHIFDLADIFLHKLQIGYRTACQSSAVTST